jgi:hypothetical protein
MSEETKPSLNKIVEDVTKSVFKTSTIFLCAVITIYIVVPRIYEYYFSSPEVEYVFVIDAWTLLITAVLTIIYTGAIWRYKYPINALKEATVAYQQESIGSFLDLDQAEHEALTKLTADKQKEIDREVERLREERRKPAEAISDSKEAIAKC